MAFLLLHNYTDFILNFEFNENERGNVFYQIVVTKYLHIN